MLPNQLYRKAILINEKAYYSSMTNQYQIVVFDLDGVLVDTESSWGYVHNHFGETNEANVKAYFNGEIDDHEFMRRDIAIWKSHKPDLGISDISAILSEISLIPGAEETLRELRSNGFKLAIISGGLEPLANRVAELVEFDYVYANGLGSDASGRLTAEGKLNVPLMNKEQVLEKMLVELSIPAEKCVAVGDSKVDAGMLKLAGLGIAFCPIDETVINNADVVVTEKNLKDIMKYII